MWPRHPVRQTLPLPCEDLGARARQARSGHCARSRCQQGSNNRCFLAVWASMSGEQVQLVGPEKLGLREGLSSA